MAEKCRGAALSLSGLSALSLSGSDEDEGSRRLRLGLSESDEGYRALALGGGTPNQTVVQGFRLGFRLGSRLGEGSDSGFRERALGVALGSGSDSGFRERALGLALGSGSGLVQLQVLVLVGLGFIKLAFGLPAFRLGSIYSWQYFYSYGRVITNSKDTACPLRSTISSAWSRIWNDKCRSSRMSVQ